eukprot:gene8281-14239_t
MESLDYTPCCSLEVHRSVEDVCNSPTLVSQIGKNSHSKFCVVVVTGNPGMIEFYEVFMLQLHKASKCHLEVVGISQAGHSPVWKYAKDDSAQSYKKADCKNLKYQIEHKIAFVDEYVPKDKQLILIGHSIGAYIVLKMLENRRIEQRACKTVLLFPTIENLKYTPNGNFWDPVSFYFRHPFALTAWLLSFTPLWMRKMLVDWRTSWKGRDTHPQLVDAFMQCVSYTLMNNALYMAASEMKHVNEVDENMAQIIDRNINKITFYYGVDDKWAPVHFYDSMKKRFPNGDIRLCEHGFEHDFVVDSSEDVAGLVWDMISHLNNK